MQISTQYLDTRTEYLTDRDSILGLRKNSLLEADKRCFKLNKMIAVFHCSSQQELSRVSESFEVRSIVISFMGAWRFSCRIKEDVFADFRGLEILCGPLGF